MGTTFLRRRRFTPIAIVAGLIGSSVLGLGVTGTFSAMTATILNTNDTAGTGSLIMQETDSAGTPSGSCKSSDVAGNSSTCAAFNKYGGRTDLVPGGTASTNVVRIYNIGSFAAGAFTFTPQACSNSGANNPLNTSGNICSFLRLTLTCTVTTGGNSVAPVTVYDGTTSASSLTSIAATGAADLKTTKACLPAPTTVGGNSYTTFNFSVKLDSSADNTVQGQTGSQPIQWQFTA